MFAPAENRTEPSPCPCVGEPIVSHDESLLTAHWQSRFVVICTEPEPPDAGTEGLSALACNAHFVDEGAVMLSVWEDDPQADATSAASASVAAVVNERKSRRSPTVGTVIDPGCTAFVVKVY